MLKHGCVCAWLLSCVRLFATPWTIAHQAPLSMGVSRQEYWSGLPCPPPGDLPNPGIKPRSPVLQADSLSSEPLGKFTVWINLENIVLSEKKKKSQSAYCIILFILKDQNWKIYKGRQKISGCFGLGSLRGKRR